MRNWTTMTPEEKRTAKSGRDQFALRKVMDNCLSNVLNLLAGNECATKLAWALPWGNYLVNTAEEIANYCKSKAMRTLTLDISRPLYLVQTDTTKEVTT